MDKPRLEVVYVDPSKLRPNGWNPNVMTDAMLSRLRAEIWRVGFVDPVIALRDGRIIDGEHRWKIASERKENVPVVYLDVSEEIAKTLTINLDAIHGDHDPALLVDLIKSLGFSEPEVESVFGMKPREMESLRRSLEPPGESSETPAENPVDPKNHICPRCKHQWPR